MTASVRSCRYREMNWAYTWQVNRVSGNMLQKLKTRLSRDNGKGFLPVYKKSTDWYLLIHLFSLVRDKFYSQSWLPVCTHSLLETISAGWKSNNYLRSIHQSHLYKTNVFLSCFFLLSLEYVLKKPSFESVTNIRDLCSDFTTDFRA